MMPTLALNRVSAWRAIFAVGALAAQVYADGQTTEAGEASISDPNVECVPYGYPPVSSAMSQFPPIWSPASLVPGDADAAAKWAAIQPNVPNIAPKGTLDGNFTGVNYSPSDPDCWWTWNQCTTPKAPGLVADVSVMPEPQTLGYGFDDGPNCSHNAFYDYLTTQNQKATMFYIGSNVMDWPLEAQRAVTDGHEICVHTWSHNYMTSFASEDAFAELYYTLKAIKLVTGVTPTCWRPPFGDIDDRIRAIATGMGLRTIIWTYDSEDWQFGSKAGITSQDVDNNYQQMITDANNGKFASAGTMILSHELNAYTMSEAMKFYPLLKKAFAHIVPVGVGLNITTPYLETNITMPNFAQYTSGQTKLAPNASAINTAAAIATSIKTGTASPSTTTSATTTQATAGTTTAAHKSGAGAARLHFGALVLCVVGAMVHSL